MYNFSIKSFSVRTCMHELGIHKVMGFITSQSCEFSRLPPRILKLFVTFANHRI
jgi:hypothetical protein